MKLPKFLQPHTVQIEEYLGNSAGGPLYDAPYSITCYFQEKHKLVENDEGDEVMSNSQLFTSEELDLEPNSRVSYQNKKYDVITTSPKTNALTGQQTQLEVYMR